MKITKISILLLALSLNFVACSSSDDAVEETPDMEQPGGDQSGGGQSDGDQSTGDQSDTSIPQKDFITKVTRNTDNIPVISFSEIDNIPVSKYQITTELETSESTNTSYTFTESEAINNFYLGDNTIEVTAINANNKKVALDNAVYNHSVFNSRGAGSRAITVEVKRENTDRFVSVITYERLNYTSVEFKLNDVVVRNATPVDSYLLPKFNLVKGLNKLRVGFTSPSQSGGSTRTSFLNLQFIIRDTDIPDINIL